MEVRWLLYIVFIRVLIIYALIILSLRLMGKRQIGQLQPSELVVTILVSNIATMAIEDSNVPLIGGIHPHPHAGFLRRSHLRDDPAL